MHFNDVCTALPVWNLPTMQSLSPCIVNYSDGRALDDQLHAGALEALNAVAFEVRADAVAVRLDRRRRAVGRQEFRRCVRFLAGYEEVPDLNECAQVGGRSIMSSDSAHRLMTAGVQPQRHTHLDHRLAAVAQRDGVVENLRQRLLLDDAGCIPRRCAGLR